MKSRLKHFMAGCLAAIMLLSVTSCGSSSSAGSSSGSSSSAVAAIAAADEPQKGGTMIFGLSNEPKTLAPYAENGYAQKQIVYSIYRNLFSTDINGESVPGLCKDYTVSEDNLTWTFYLVDAKFQNGDPVTAEDVKFTMEYIRDNDDLGAFLTANFKKYIKEVNVIDDKTVEVITTEPCAVLKSWLGSFYAGILSKSWTETHDLTTDPMGAGPFKFVSWERGSSITLERFDDCYEGAPYLDGIEFDFYLDENARINALKTGVVDLIDYVSSQHFASIESSDDLVMDKANGPFMFLVLDNNYKPLDDPKVRLAIAYAINRQDVIDMAFDGEGEAMYGTAVTAMMDGYSEKYDNYYTYDVEKAKELLAEAGYPDGFDLTIGCSSQYKFNENTAVAIQANLKEIGINVTLEASDWATFYAKHLDNGFAASVNGVATYYSDIDWLSYLFSTDGSFNRADYSNAEVDALFAQARSELDSDKRAELYGQLQQILLDEAPWVNLMWRVQGYAHNKRLHGFVELPNGQFVMSALTFGQCWLEQ
ncbi:MAG: ABC transporter substrate-binding protein [Lawsonibacter sp.]